VNVLLSEVADGVVLLVPAHKETEQDQLLENVMVNPGFGDKTFAQIAQLLLIARAVYIGNPIVNGAVPEEENAENGVPFLVADN